MFLLKNILLLVAAATVYGLYISASYTSSVREHPSFWLLGLVPAMTGSLIWTWGIRIQSSDTGILFFGLAMDTVIVLLSVWVPVAIFNLRINHWSVLGITLILAGVTVLKLAN